MTNTVQYTIQKYMDFTFVPLPQEASTLCTTLPKFKII